MHNRLITYVWAHVYYVQYFFGDRQQSDPRQDQISTIKTELSL